MKSDQRRAKGAAEATQTVASATECTGLMPALPEDEAQDAAEAELYGIHDAAHDREEK